MRPREEKNKTKETEKTDRVIRQLSAKSAKSALSKGSQKSIRSRGRPRLTPTEETEPKIKNPRGRRPKELGSYEVEATNKITNW